MAVTLPSPPGAAPALSWYRGATVQQRRALLAAALGWMLDSMDFMLYSMVLAYIMSDLSMSKPMAGLVGMLIQLAAATGGLFFGAIADRYGRTRAMIGSILIYSLFTAVSGLAQTITQLAILRMIVGFGLGGEFAAGAALVTETWPAQHRGKALGVVHSFWAIGYAVAALATFLILPRWGWRGVFFVGAIPAVITLWIRRSVEEPAIWREGRHRAVTAPASIRQLFTPAFRRYTIAMMLLNAGALFTYWGFNYWNPAYLSLAPDQGGLGFSARMMSAFVMVMQISTWVGYLVFGGSSDRFGRKKIFVAYLVLAACFLALYPAARSSIAIMALGSGVGFFGTGFFAGFGPVVSELFPTQIRGMALAVTYNAGRIVSATAPYVVGRLASANRGFSLGFTLCSVALLFSASMWFFVPETKGRELE